MTMFRCNDSHNLSEERDFTILFFLMKECRGWGFWWNSTSKPVMHLDYLSFLRKQSKVKYTGKLHMQALVQDTAFNFISITKHLNGIIELNSLHLKIPISKNTETTITEKKLEMVHR